MALNVCKHLCSNQAGAPAQDAGLPRKGLAQGNPLRSAKNQVTRDLKGQEGVVCFHDRLWDTVSPQKSHQKDPQGAGLPVVVSSWPQAVAPVDRSPIWE